MKVTAGFRRGIFILGVLLLVAAGRAQETPLEQLAKQFQNPGPQWRGMPLWAVSGALKPEEARRGIHTLAEMGMGGVIIDSRAEAEAIRACAAEAKKLGLEAWLDVRDRGTSGTAGAAAPLDPKYQARWLTLRIASPADARTTLWAPGVVAAFAVRLGANRIDFSESQRLTAQTPAAAWQGKDVLVFRVETVTAPSPGFGGADRLNREATEEFIRRTLEPHRERGELADGAIKGIFLDGGAFGGAGKTAGGLPGVPWTEKLAERFRTKYQTELLDQLPELFLRPEGRKIVPVKWQYWDLVNELAQENFARPLQEWCRRNKVLAAGDAAWMGGGSAMRSCEYLDVPGIAAGGDGNRDIRTIERIVSAARQLGRKRVLMEYEGAAVGNVPALLGINLHCPRWTGPVASGREARPAEDYAARLGLLLGQGKPACDVLVIDSAESVWAQGAAAGDAEAKPIEERQATLFKWLADAQIDFDTADEALLARWGHVERSPDGKSVLYVGQAPYRAVVVGGLLTLRETTLNLVGDFVSGGGYIVYAGELPAHLDAVVNSANESLSGFGMRVEWHGQALTETLGSALRNPVQALGEGETAVGDVWCQMREDGGRRWLVAANVNATAPRRGVRMRVGRPGTVIEWDCRDGSRRAVTAADKDGMIEWTADFAPGQTRAWSIAAE